MVTEQNKTLDALKIAVQMEIDGKEFYMKASEGSGNRLGRELLESLAAEEDIHRQKFEEIYNAISSKKDWPKTDFQPDEGKKLRTMFSEATEGIGTYIKTPSTAELDAVQTAMEMENKTYDFYKKRSEKAIYEGERKFYESLAAQERQHHIILLDYYEYLKDPVGWFTNKEHVSLDGG